MSKDFFLSLQGSYKKLTISLFNDTEEIETLSENNLKASSLLVPYIEKILTNNFLSLKNLKFISIDQGPGAFTSLRVVISTVNGISFASKIPLIGINGLRAIAEESILSIKDEQPDLVVPILNAYNNEVYFSLYSINPEIKNKQKLCLVNSIEHNKGYLQIQVLLESICKKFKNKRILFTGNGLKLHIDTIKKYFEKNTIFCEFETCSTKQIAKIALKNWENQIGISYKLTPLYLKSQKFAIKTK